MNQYQEIYYKLAYFINKELYKLEKISYNTYKYTENSLIIKLRK